VSRGAPDGYTVEAARGHDVDPWLASLAEQVRDNGRDGVWFSPRSPDDGGPARTIESVLGWVARLARSEREPGWFRLWIARDREGTIVGHADLSGGRLTTELHRAELGMGIERPHRGVGLGPALLGTALSWARESGTIDWVELGVFSSNARARRLYERFGFEQIGCVPDRFRVDGAVIDDVRMALRLR
jgi:RimJ/RimL family protein N-acetyltransferase